MGNAGKSATRKCCATGHVLPKSELIRFALGPDGRVYPDVTGKAGGRGVWVTGTAGQVTGAQQNNRFAHALKSHVTVPGNLVALTRDHLQMHLVGALQLARKGGYLVFGATKVHMALEKGVVDALIIASDAGKAAQRLIGTKNMDRNLPRIDVLNAQQLSLAFGGKNVIHAALTGGGAAKTAKDRHKRLVQFDAVTDQVSGT